MTVQCRRITTAALAGAALAALAGAGAASAGSAAGGQVWVFVTANGRNHQNVLVAGAIGDYGSGRTVDASGKPNQNGKFEQLKLHKGTVLIDAAKFNAASNNPRPIIRSKTTCSAVLSWSAPVTIISGTGAYKGITGTLNMKGTFAGVSARFRSGPRKGRCELGSNVQPLDLYVSITGTGHAKLG